jgi:hypothetical protein
MKLTKKKEKLATVEDEKNILALLSGVLEMILWHEYLDEKYITDKRMKKVQNDLIKKIEDAQALCAQIMDIKEARKGQSIIHGETK